MRLQAGLGPPQRTRLAMWRRGSSLVPWRPLPLPWRARRSTRGHLTPLRQELWEQQERRRATS